VPVTFSAVKRLVGKSREYSRAKFGDDPHLEAQRKKTAVLPSVETLRSVAYPLAEVNFSRAVVSKLKR